MMKRIIIYILLFLSILVSSVTEAGMKYLGDYTTTNTIYVYFDSFNVTTGASISITGLTITDIKIYKNEGVVERASTNGYTLLDTDGMDFDGMVGINGFSINLFDNSDTGFYTIGNEYVIVVDNIVVDTQTVRFVV